MVLEAIRYRTGSLQIIDQLQLPRRSIWVEIRSVEQAWKAIREMQVRGAPAIAMVAILSINTDLQNRTDTSEGLGQLQTADEMRTYILDRLNYLVTSRPTAVNLRDAASKLEVEVEHAARQEGSTGALVRDRYIALAERMLHEDVETNVKIGRYGADWITKQTGGGKISVMTHCNTGSLATAGYGTALGIIRSLYGDGHLQKVFAGETRPYNQGARLTVYELVHDKIPVVLITDSMAASAMARDGENKIAAIIVGADRVAANGDTANKIGTYSLAVLARHHNVAFVVAAPTTTIDLKTRSGKDIVIETRLDNELTRLRGPIVEEGERQSSRFETVQIAAEGCEVWNPAFDVTPASLIDCIVTELGVFEKVGGNFRFPASFTPSKTEKEREK